MAQIINDEITERSPTLRNIVSQSEIDNSDESKLAAFLKETGRTDPLHKSIDEPVTPETEEQVTELAPQDCKLRYRRC